MSSGASDQAFHGWSATRRALERYVAGRLEADSVVAAVTDAYYRKTGKGKGSPPAWSPEAQERLARVPGFVRGMVRRIYLDYAKDRGIAEITPAVMDTARTELGLEGM